MRDQNRPGDVADTSGAGPIPGTLAPSQRSLSTVSPSTSFTSATSSPIGPFHGPPVWVTYSKNRLGKGPTKFYENEKTITGNDADVDRITNHVLGDACTPGNPKECTFTTVRPVVDHCMNGDLDDLLQ